MAGLLFFVTLMLDLVSVACVGVYLWLNNFTTRTDLTIRNKGLKRIAGFTMGAAILLAFLTCLLAGSGDPESALKLTVALYIIIAVSMILVIFASCGILIFRMISKREVSDEKANLWHIILMAAIGAVISVVLTWLLM